jgi:hypothetical protein
MGSNIRASNIKIAQRVIGKMYNMFFLYAHYRYYTYIINTILFKYRRIKMINATRVFEIVFTIIYFFTSRMLLELI